MRQGRVDRTAGAGIAAGILAWPRKLARLELSAESLTWFAVLIGVILRVWEYLEFRPLYMDEDCAAEEPGRPRGVRFPSRPGAGPDGPAGIPGRSSG